MNPENIQSIKLTILSCLLLFHFDDGEAFPSKGLKQPKNNSSCDCDKLIFAHVVNKSQSDLFFSKRNHFSNEINFSDIPAWR